MATVKIEVQGRVQGVGYRAYIAKLAQEIGLNGEVWNTKSGNVGAVFQHESAEKLRECLIRLYDGPGRIDRVVPELLSNEATFLHFEIKPDRL